jgi:hypothetical protein
MGNFRPRISQDEFEVVKQYRAIKRESNELGLDDGDVKHGWLKSKNASLFFKNPNFKESEETNYKELQEQVLKDIREFKPEYPTIFRNPSTDGHLLVVDPADIHIGKLCEAFETGEDYSLHIIRTHNNTIHGLVGNGIDKWCNLFKNPHRITQNLIDFQPIGTIDWMSID